MRVLRLYTDHNRQREGDTHALQRGEERGAASRRYDARQQSSHAKACVSALVVLGPKAHLELENNPVP